jgi:uncharacterized membrane protein (DUF485 family)
MDVTAADTERIERSPEFRELVAARRRFVLPATVFFLVWYLGFILLAGYAPDFMGESVYEGLTLGYVLALSQFLMTGVLGIWYLRRADKTWDPLRERALAAAERSAPEGGQRFERDQAAATPEVPR